MNGWEIEPRRRTGTPPRMHHAVASKTTNPLLTKIQLRDALGQKEPCDGVFARLRRLIVITTGQTISNFKNKFMKISTRTQKSENPIPPNTIAIVAPSENSIVGSNMNPSQQTPAQLVAEMKKILRRFKLTFWKQDDPQLSAKNLTEGESFMQVYGLSWPQNRDLQRFPELLEQLYRAAERTKTPLFPWQMTSAVQAKWTRLQIEKVIFEMIDRCVATVPASPIRQFIGRRLELSREKPDAPIDLKSLSISDLDPKDREFLAVLTDLSRETMNGDLLEYEKDHLDPMIDANLAEIIRAGSSSMSRRRIVLLKFIVVQRDYLLWMRRYGERLNPFLAAVTKWQSKEILSKLDPIAFSPFKDFPSLAERKLRHKRKLGNTRKNKCVQRKRSRNDDKSSPMSMF